MIICIRWLRFLLLSCGLALLAPPRLCAADSLSFSAHFRLLPQPQRIEFLSGQGLPYSALQTFTLTNTAVKPVMSGLLSTLQEIQDSNRADLRLVLLENMSLPSPEGYVLKLTAKAVTITAPTDAGLFYGIQTLQQLLEDARDQHIPVPPCRITDFPQIAYRAIHLDMKHHVEKGFYYYHIIDQLASVKVNAIIAEFEDKLRYRKAPVVGSPDAISLEEFAAISRYAHERHIEISPLVQGLGHAAFILKHAEYKDLRDDSTSDWVFDPMNPKTYDLQFALYEDAMAATPYGRYLHIGGDEVGALGKSALSKQSGLSPIDLQLYWLKKVTDFAKAHNRIPIFWDDMLFKLSNLYETTYDTSIGSEKAHALWASNEHLIGEKIRAFPENCVYMRWNYDDASTPGNRLAIGWYQAHGLNVMGATAAQCMSAMMPRNHSNFRAIKGYAQLSAEKGLNGLLCTVWDDCSPHFETIWRGLYAFALFSWNKKDIPVETAEQLFRHRFYGPGLAPASFEFQDSLENALPFWETALLKEGDRDNYHKQFRLIDLPDPAKPGSWSRLYADRLAGAALQEKKYAAIRDKIDKARSLARRNQYALSVMNAINELQVYPARLLLRLQAFDKASAKAKPAAYALVRREVSDFDRLRAAVEKVYGETRILGNPDGYQLDANLHEHLANGTLNTDWMYVYELAMNDRIRKWNTDTARVVGFGGGGATFHPAVSPFNKDLAVVSCDMTGSYITHDGGTSWRMFNLHEGAGFYVFDPLDSNTIYAHSIALFRSEDKGRTWRAVYPDPSEIVGVVSRGDHASDELVTRDSTVRKMLAMTIDPADSKKLYAVIEVNKTVGFYYSADRGRHWTSGYSLPQRASQIFIDPASPPEDRSVYIADVNGIVSRQHGQWKRYPGPDSVKRLTQVTGGRDESMNAFVLYAISGRSYENPKGDVSGIYFSADAGRTWENRESGLNKLSWMGGVAGRTEMKGETGPGGLTTNRADPPEWRAIGTSFHHPNVLYVSYNNFWTAADTQAIGVARSTDYGKTWALCWKDLRSKGWSATAPNFEGGWINDRFGPSWGENPFDLGVAPGDADVCYATDFGRTIKTMDGGQHWQQVYSKPSPDGGRGWISRGLDVTTGYNLVADPYDDRHVFMANTDIGLMESEDGGVSWSSATKSNGVPRAWENTTYWLEFDSAVKGKAWAVMSGTHDLPRPKMWRHKGVAGFRGGVLVTEDAGKTWKPQTRAVGEFAFTHILIDPASPPSSRTLYACAFGKGVYKSKDGGATWALKNNGLDGAEPFAWRIICDRHDGRLYLIVSRRREDGGIGNDQDGALYYSTDGAEHWKKMSLPPEANDPTCLIADPQKSDRIILSAWGRAVPGRSDPDLGGGIYLSNDRGMHWESVLTGDQHIHDLSFDPRINRYYACGFESAAWFSDNGGRDWSRIKGYNFKWGKRVEPDPNDPGFVYIITYGGGMWHLPVEAADRDSDPDIVTPEVNHRISR